MPRGLGAAEEQPSAKKAEVFLRKLQTTRTPLVSKKMLAKVGRISKDRKKSIAFLKKGGFLDQNGKLSVKYRTSTGK